jgi:hypothetical protein
MKTVNNDPGNQINPSSYKKAKASALTEGLYALKVIIECFLLFTTKLMVCFSYSIASPISHHTTFYRYYFLAQLRASTDPIEE